MSKIGVPIIKIFLKNSEEANPGVSGINNGDRMWIEYSTHVSIKDAKKVINQLNTRYGADQVMLCQVIDLESGTNII